MPAARRGGDPAGHRHARSDRRPGDGRANAGARSPRRSSTARPTPRSTRPRASRRSAGRSTPRPSSTWFGRAASSIARWCKSAPITCSAACRRRRGRGARTTPASRRASMHERNWKASGPPPGIRSTDRSHLRAVRPAVRPAGGELRQDHAPPGRARPELRIVADQHCTPTYVPHLARAILFLLGIRAIRLKGHPSR